MSLIKNIKIIKVNDLYYNIFKYSYDDFPDFFDLRNKWLEERLYELFLKKKNIPKINSLFSEWKKSLEQKKLADLDNHDIFYKESENLSLKEYLDKYCEKVDEKEQKELDELMKNINLEEDEGSEITLEDFLQNNI